jgi:MoaA/NifB/PqqE/SkfB family radical SAM enzyme
MTLHSLLNLYSDTLYSLPMVIIYVTDKCNSRCLSCDYWRHGQNEISLDLVHEIADELSRFGTRYVLLSGGEPLQHPEWEKIASALKEKNLKVALATSGILLPKFADVIPAAVDELYLSLDGATPESYQSIRGVDGFELIERGVGKLRGTIPLTIRTTVQRANYREIPALIRLSRSWGASHHSFLAVDVSTHAAFARSGAFDRSLALREEDLDPLERILADVQSEFGREFSEGYLTESGAKLHRLHQYFAALLGLNEFPPARCNAPSFSAVIETDGTLKPCFFLPPSGRFTGSSLAHALNTPSATALRREQKLGHRLECLRCVCPAHKGIRQRLEEP